MKRIPVFLILCLMFPAMTACRGEATGSSPQASGDDAATIDAAAGEETPGAALPRTAAPAPSESVEPGHLAGRFGLRNDVLDLKAAGSDEAKVFDLKADGRYVFTGGVIVSREEGRWVLEENGTRLRLTPDRILPESGELLFAVSSRDRLLMLNLDGSPLHVPAGLARIER